MRLPNSDFWLNKRVLLTGHTGFKGSWLSMWLQALGATIRGIALPPPNDPSLFRIARVADGMEHTIIDIRDRLAVMTVVQDFKPEIVIHMAAQPLVRVSYREPVETYETNVMGTVHVLEAVRCSESVKAVVIVTTDKCYENRGWVWGYREDEPMGGYDPYSSSKACVELVSSAYRRSFFMGADIGLATARAGNVIGGGDWAEDRLVPDILRALQSGVPIQIRHPYAIRPWQHVLDPLSGYLLLAEQLFERGQTQAEGWNFGPFDADALPVHQIVEQFCDRWGVTASSYLQNGEHPHEADYLKLDISKARQRLQWSPRWSIDVAISRVVDWHKAWIDGQDMRAVCMKQIADYGANAQ